MTKTKRKRPNTRSNRSVKIAAWVRNTCGGSSLVSVTSEQLAEVASQELGYSVSPNRVAKELYRQGIDFVRTIEDPPEPKVKRVDLLRVRVDRMERDLSKIKKQLNLA